MKLDYSIDRTIKGFAIIALLLMTHISSVSAQTKYLVKPGDVLSISVWKEADLTAEITVHPDGTFTLPLVGEILANGRPVIDIQKDIKKSLNRFIPEAIVTVGLKSSVGSQIYVIGQVNLAGVYAISHPTDVMQALSLAQGLSAYAAKNKIRILRRSDGSQVAIPFKYGEVIKGENLKQNILLHNGDVVVVP